MRISHIPYWVSPLGDCSRLVAGAVGVTVRALSHRHAGVARHVALTLDALGIARVGQHIRQETIAGHTRVPVASERATRRRLPAIRASIERRIVGGPTHVTHLPFR